ncbi:uncharacterized protein VTP21DRAFT_8398 [Calcarisporiella thermophila]|uniref:uncharacterized protein n=1 Tax=Calcarisporiella thermophila TaxID=911321 RepID=UPI003743135A
MLSSTSCRRILAASSGHPTKIARNLFASSICNKIESKDSDVEGGNSNLRPRSRSIDAPISQKRARLIYQSRKRGILETDLLLSTFAHKYLDTFTSAELDEYDSLLEEPDWDIYAWATGGKKIPEQWRKSKILTMLQEHTKNKKKEFLRMPNLKPSN